MSTTCNITEGTARNITEKTGYTHTRVSSSFEGVRTFQHDRFKLDKATTAAAVVAEATYIIQDSHTNFLRATRLPEIGDDYTPEEELEWDTLFAQPHVQAGLDRLEEEAMRQYLAGKTVEGGFAVE